MSPIAKIPQDVKNEAIDTVSDILNEYSKTKPRRRIGKAFRLIAMIGSRLSFVLKHVGINSQPKNP